MPGVQANSRGGARACVYKGNKTETEGPSEVGCNGSIALAAAQKQCIPC